MLKGVFQVFCEVIRKDSPSKEIYTSKQNIFSKISYTIEQVMSFDQ